jgi:hypothetical protein
LFSCSRLEQEEFLAITEADKDEELVSNYVRLFYGLNLKLASDGIQSEIERISSSLLFSSSPEESERKVLGLVALYPHPDVYRAAMHFFQHAKKLEEVRSFAWKLFDLVPDDEEAQIVLAKIYLNSSRNIRLRENDKKDAIRVLEILWKKGKLTAKESIQYADFLENAEQYSQSFDIALSIYEDIHTDIGIKNRARTIAARTALKLGNSVVAADIIESVPSDQLDSSLALVAVELRMNTGDSEGAFEIAKTALSQDFNSTLLRHAAALANQLGKTDEIEEITRNSRDFQLYSRQPGFRREIRQLGLSGLVDEDEF